MEINSLADLDNLEAHIAKIFGKLKLGDVLHSLYLLKKDWPEIKPFMVAGVSLFAVRFCTPSNPFQSLNNCNIRFLIDLYKKYYFADPITFDKDLYDDFMNSNPVFPKLRLGNSQFPFKPGRFSQFSRPFWLFYEIPRQLQGLPGIPPFDFESNFQAITGVSVLDFITTAFVVSAAAQGNFAVNRDYFKKTRKQGINIPDDLIVNKILNQLAADKFKLIELYEKRKNTDRRFRMYDFNPLLYYPVIKPCQNKQFSLSDKDYIHAPVPELVDSRISTGIFYQMYNAYTPESGTNFSEYFGYVFEKYVGVVLKHCITLEQLLSEEDIRQFYPAKKGAKKGKVPDWVLKDGSTLILFECKISRFSIAAKAIASEDEIDKSLKQVIKGLKQLSSFIFACQTQVQGLEMFHKCTTLKPILVSLEPLCLINTTDFREHINSLLAKENINNLDWQILSIDELEELQPHIGAGFKLAQILNDLWTKTFDDIHQELKSQTNKTFVDSFLYPKQEELYQRLDIPKKISENKHS
jgi:hypothetical protein